MSAFYFVITIFCLSILLFIPQNSHTKSMFQTINAKSQYLDNYKLSLEKKPILKIDEVISIYKNESFDYRDYIRSAQDSDILIDLTNKVEVFFEKIEDKSIQTIDTSILGSRVVKYVLSYRGVKTIQKQIVIVKE